MRAAVITAPRTVEIRTVPDPVAGVGEVVVAVHAVGICGTDLHIYEGEIAPSYPVIPGHEFSGEVIEVGPEVTGFALGDRVSADPNLPCHACPSCRRGRANLCENYSAIGVTRDGAAAEYVAVPAANCVRLPDHVGPNAAALIEPLSCAVRGYDVLGARMASHTLVYGAGTMGLMMTALAGRAGAASVTVVDTNAERAAAAAPLGCRAVSDPARLDGEHFDVVIDCTGAVPAIQDGLARVASGGTFLQFGVASPEAKASFSPFDIYRREITVVGSMAVLHSFDRAADLMAQGVLDAGFFVTGHYALDEYADALAEVRSGRGRKTHVEPTR